MRAATRYRASLYLLLSPYLLGVAVLVVIPVALSLGLAFTVYDGLSAPTWHGLGNFREVLDDPLFRIAVGNSVAFVALTVPMRVLIALALALLLGGARRGVNAYRVAVYVPTIVPGVAYALVWLWILNPRYGPLNRILEDLGLPAPAWLVDTSTALPAVALTALFQVGEGFVVLLAGLRAIPEECRHASALDGAGRVAMLRHITLPLMGPWLLLLTIRDIIVSVHSTFTPALVMTGGGPYYATLFVPLLMYETAFDRLRFGQGAAMTLIVLGVVGALIALTYRAAGGWGTLMCIPQNLSSLVVYYNRDLFDRAGVPRPTDDWTWDDFLHAAKALTRDARGSGRIAQYGLGTEVSIFRLAPFIWQNGGELVDHAAAPTRLMLDAPAAREATQWFVELQTRHRVVPDAVEEKAESSESRFLNGRLGMFLNSRRGVPTYRTITSFDWDVVALPRRRHRAGILHADAYCMPKTAKHKAATWTFIEYANSPDGQRAIARSGRTVPSLRILAESPAFLDPAARPRSSRVFLSEIPHLRAVPVTDGWVDVEDLAGEELARAYYGRVSLDEAIATAVRRAAPFFRPAPEPARTR